VPPPPARISTIDDDPAPVRVESLNHDGRGVARVKGKVTFIDGALPGEDVRFRYHHKHRHYDDGFVTEIISPSLDRITPPCPHFGTCGGCSLQHLRPEAQILAKQAVLQEALARIGRVEPDRWLAPLTGPAWHYRRRARLGVRQASPNGGVLIGFREKRRSLIASLDACPVLDEKISALLPALKELVAALSCPDRIPQIELAVADNASALVFRHLVALTDADLDKLCSFARRYDIQIHLQGRGPDSIKPLWPETPEELYYRLPEYGVELHFGPSDFIQVNGEMNRKMVHQALELLEVQAHEQVLDLFCGLGNFTLPLARRAARVLGVESEAGLVAAARRNAALNNLDNAEFQTANLYDDTGVPPWAGVNFDKLLLDPPRSGAMAVIQRLGEPRPTRLVYVACDPATLARDSGYLVSHLGYRLAAAGVLDMFPHTSHVESMAVFIRP
jgi:23S rRNA (uracil1939-C5)-methyltransferase